MLSCIKKILFNPFRACQETNFYFGKNFSVKKRKISDSIYIEKLLFAVAQTFVNILRHNDIVVRWGGEEFLLITFIRENKMINTIGNKIVKIIQSTFIEIENQIIRFTVSGGGTLLREEILNAINREDKLILSLST